MLVVEDRKCRFRPKDWVCTDPLCGNVNYQWRKNCNKCNKSRDEKVAPIVKVIGESAAKKSEGLFLSQDWQCKNCGNVNWARRQECYRCQTGKFDPINMINPDEIISDEDDNVSEHSALSSPPALNENDSDDSGIVHCERIEDRTDQNNKDIALTKMKALAERLSVKLLGVPEEDYRNENSPVHKCIAALILLIAQASIRTGGDINLSEAGMQAMEEEIKASLMRSDILRPAQKAALASMSSNQVLEMYRNMMPKLLGQLIGVPATPNEVNPSAAHNPEPQPPRPEHQCHGLNRAPHPCCSAQPTAHHCDCSLPRPQGLRYCDRRLVSCCDQASTSTSMHHCSGSCCEQSRPVHPSHTHERPTVPRISNVQEERRVVFTGERSRSRSPSPQLERRRVVLPGRRSPSPSLRRHMSGNRSPTRYVPYSRASRSQRSPRREDRTRRTDRDRDQYRRRYSPDGRHGRVYK